VLSGSSLAVDSKKKKITSGLLFWFPILEIENQPAIRIFKCILTLTFRSKIFKVITENMEDNPVPGPR
jgi:hypothetical protein